MQCSYINFSKHYIKKLPIRPLNIMTFNTKRNQSFNVKLYKFELLYTLSDKQLLYLSIGHMHLSSPYNWFYFCFVIN